MNILIAIGVLLILVSIVIFEIFIVASLKVASDCEEVYEEKIIEKPKKVELTEEQKKKQEKLRESFENLMGYGYEDALKSKGE